MEKLLKNIVVVLILFAVGVSLNLTLGANDASARISCEDDYCAYSEEWEEWVCRDASDDPALDGYNCNANPDEIGVECQENICDVVDPE